MVRTPCCDKTGLKKGTWTPEEDRKLIAYVTKYGYWNWRQLPKYAGNNLKLSSFKFLSTVIRILNGFHHLGFLI